MESLKDYEKLSGKEGISPLHSNFVLFLKRESGREREKKEDKEREKEMGSSVCLKFKRIYFIGMFKALRRNLQNKIYL